MADGDGWGGGGGVYLELMCDYSVEKTRETLKCTHACTVSVLIALACPSITCSFNSVHCTRIPCGRITQSMFTIGFKVIHTYRIQCDTFTCRIQCDTLYMSLSGEVNIAVHQCEISVSALQENVFVNNTANSTGNKPFL